MKIFSFLTALFLLITGALVAQVGINADNSAPDNSAMLDVKSTDKGLLLPRMTTSQMNAYTWVSPGLMVYNTTLHSICWFNGNSWDITSNLDGKDCGTVTYGGKTYNSVIIGTQCWMTENLDIGTLVIRSQEQTNNAVIEKYCYDDNPANCDVYGGLYQWAELVQYLNGATNTTRWNPEPTGVVQGICPAGWHIPSDDEWCQLGKYIEATTTCSGWGNFNSDLGGKLKETGTTHWASPNAGATNSSGFTALPGGQRIAYGTNDFAYLTLRSFFWSATSMYAAPSTAYYVSLFNQSALGFKAYYDKTFGYSARCCKD